MSGVTRCCSPYLRVRSVTGRPCTKITMDVQELNREVAPGVDVKAWTFNGSYMGPILHGKLGDVFEITLEITGRWGIRLIPRGHGLPPIIR